MNAIRIRKKIDSETLHLPELRPLLGHTVEIVVFDNTITDRTEAAPVVTPGTGDWDAAARAAQELRESGYNFDAWEQQREFDLQHANDHLP